MVISSHGLVEAPLAEKVAHAEALLSAFTKEPSLKGQAVFLFSQPLVQNFLKRSASVAELLETLPPEERTIALAVIALGQGDVVLQLPQDAASAKTLLRTLTQQLLEVEAFYQPLGGLIGYYTAVIREIYHQKQAEGGSSELLGQFHRPEGIDLCGSNKSIWKAVMWGLETLPMIAEVWPIGGAGDRLGLVEKATGEPLPAACLEFGGRTLLEGLVRDLQARESLAYKLSGKQYVTPVALMTSHDKDNHTRILEICEQHHWFGRPRESFRLFTQGLVPVITEEGNWALSEPLRLVRKPGGHGVLWQLMRQQGIYDWLKAHGRTKALIRQINNPVAGVDHGLLALTGYGCHENKQFGFAACHREVGTAEGVDVFFERPTEKGYAYGISNIEYTEFERYGIEDVSCEPGSSYSKYPSNTNILFVDLEAMEWLCHKVPVPGMLVNLKKRESYLDPNGKLTELPAGRLESTMQNIADYIVILSDKRKSQKELTLPTFVTYNARHKTISVTKNCCREGGRVRETPQGAYLDQQRGYRELLEGPCGVELPDEAVHVAMLPSLGPLWSTIAAKIQGGRIGPGSELQLEIDQLLIENLQLRGSLLVTAQQPLGHRSAEERRVYSDRCGKCQLINVRVDNEGIDRTADNLLWKNQVERLEQLEIVLQGSGEFYAKDVAFKGDQTIIVADGERVVATPDGESVLLTRQPLLRASWQWNYTVNQDRWIKLSR